MALIGIEAGRKVQWLRDNKSALPSMAVLLAVTVFWVVGAVGGIGFLTEASSPMSMLVGLYVMLAGVAVSIIVATLALNDLVSRYSRPRTRR
jgi:Kef-type K+ transport system membrane component KefB